MKNTNIRRNQLDYLITDTMPVELPELYSLYRFYQYLFEKKAAKNLKSAKKNLLKIKHENKNIMFNDPTWSTAPLKFKIIKNQKTTRTLSLIQPLSAINIYFFIDLYQKEILPLLEKKAIFSIRYHSNNSNLYYKAKKKKTIEYIEQKSHKFKKDIIQQSGLYFNLKTHSSLTDFFNSPTWEIANHQYKFFAKADYKSCFDSIYTHTFKWIVEAHTIDSKNAKNTNLFITIDKILQNINGKSSNGIVIGPEFSRLIAEILLQEIDVQVYNELSILGLQKGLDYEIYRFVDDIFIFTNSEITTDKIINLYENYTSKYLLHLNEHKFKSEITPVINNYWINKTRDYVDKIEKIFDNSSMPEQLLSNGFINFLRMKNDFDVLIKEHPDYTRYIISFILSTFLNKFKKQKKGLLLINKPKKSKLLYLLDLVFYIYSYFASFDNTQKFITIFYYIKSELLKDESFDYSKIERIFTKYSFIFLKFPLQDLSNLLLVIAAHKSALPYIVEKYLEDFLEKEKNPLLWACYSIYSKYDITYHKKITDVINNNIEIALSNIKPDNMMLYSEFWYIIIFFNWQNLSPENTKGIKQLLKIFKHKNLDENNNNNILRKDILTPIIDFIEEFDSNNNHYFFNWGIDIYESINQAITYRTLQRTLFQQYKGIHGLEIFGSIN
ncbi:RNA-directed DNA polymerase [Veillonella parvula]|jgi:hypothetical protein|uniref:RNA-directed DNA polymerase n=1 Tax=Veillonella parvula TaxID=29466 RepID=UPI0024201CDA|nr:RNA-directed DNA polymerase [Veillonella parvula]MBS5153329.1 RNA-directed DNA polymerase [Veillonella parvula]